MKRYEYDFLWLIKRAKNLNLTKHVTGEIERKAANGWRYHSFIPIQNHPEHQGIFVFEKEIEPK